MFKTIRIEINAANPHIPFDPCRPNAGSAASFTILNVPRPLGKRAIERLYVQVTNVAGTSQSFEAVRVGSAWGVTVPAAAIGESGTVTNGVSVWSSGTDDNGDPVPCWILGVGDLCVLNRDGSVDPGVIRQAMHVYSSRPLNPFPGDVVKTNGVWKIFFGGEWQSLGGSGDVKHSDFSDMLEKEGMTLKEVGTMVNTLVRKLKGTSAAVFSLVSCLTSLVLTSFADGTALGPDMDFGDISPTQKLANVVHVAVDGAARPLPKYLHVIDFCDTYPDAAAWYYAQPQDYGGCSAVRDGGFLYRNYDWRFDEAAEFVVRTVAASATGAGNRRFASIGVANCGTNLTEQFVTSGKPSRYYKCLPGRVVDGINENGVVCEVNVVGGDPHESGWPTAGSIHCLGAVRHVLDHATTARSAASDLVDHLFFPAGFSQNFHWMIADERETWIVENGVASNVTAVAAKRVMTNFPILNDDYEGEGMERYQLLRRGESITNAWWTLAYLPETSPIRYSDLGTNYESIWERWAEKPREAHRGESSGGQTWWQTVHTSVYNITNRTIRIAVQETDDWYVFAVPSAGGVKPEAVREIVEPMIGAATNGVAEAIAAHHDETKFDKTGGTITREGNEPVFLIVEPGLADMTVKFADFSFTDNDARDGGKFSVGDFKLETVVGDDGWLGAMKMSVDGEGAAISVNGTNVTDKLSEIEAVVSAKRDLADNKCHETEYGDWVAHEVPEGVILYGQPVYNQTTGEWSWRSSDGFYLSEGTEDTVSTKFEGPESSFTATRSVVCVNNELYTTLSFVTNETAKVAAAKQDALPYPTNAIPIADVENLEDTLAEKLDIGSWTGGGASDLREDCNAYARSLIDHRNTSFSNEVLAVQIDTNLVSTIGELNEWIGDYGGMGATTLGGLLAALLAAVAALKKSKVGSFASVGGAAATVTDGVAELSDFFSESNTLLMGTIRYSHYAVPSGGALKDRAVNEFTFSGGSLPNFPAQVSGYARDFLLDVTATADGSDIALPETGATSVGDALAFTAGKTYIVSITEIASKKYYIRVIDTTPANEA